MEEDHCLEEGGWSKAASSKNHWMRREGTVASMRRAAAWFGKRGTPGGLRAEKRREVPDGRDSLYNASEEGLEKHKWSEVNRVDLDLTTKDWNSDDATAPKLAVTL